MRARLSSPPPNPWGYLSRYLSNVQSSAAVGSRLSNLPKKEGVEAINGLRTASGIEVRGEKGNDGFMLSIKQIKVPTASVPLLSPAYRLPSL